MSKDISTFIKECGTGQEIPDPPKFIDFCRGDVNDTASEISVEDNYSVAQFQRPINPALKSSSPRLAGASEPAQSNEPSQSPDMGYETCESPDATPRKPQRPQGSPQGQAYRQIPLNGAVNGRRIPDEDSLPQVPHNEYPMDGMTQFCRLGPPSDLSSVSSPHRPSSRDSQSEYSNPTSFSSQEPSFLGQSLTKLTRETCVPSDRNDETQKRRSPFFQNRSPFRRKSKSEKDGSGGNPQAGNRNTWAPPYGSQERPIATFSNASPKIMNQSKQSEPSPSPEPADPRAQFQLNIGNNVFDVASPDAQRRSPQKQEAREDGDPIAQALAELKGGVSKQSSMRMSADRYHGLSTPVPGGTPTAQSNSTGRVKPSHIPDRSDPSGIPPPSYERRLGAPQPAFTSRSMQQTTQRYVDQNRSMFSAPLRPNAQDQKQHSQKTSLQHQSNTYSGHSHPSNRAASPVPFRSTSPRPGMHNASTSQGNLPRAASPNPYLNQGTQATASRPRAQSSSPIKGRNDLYGGYRAQGGSPAQQTSRAHSPQSQSAVSQHERPASRAGEMAVQLAPSNGYLPQPRYRAGGQTGMARPASEYGSAPSMEDQRTRSKSIPDGRQFARDGRPILHFGKFKNSRPLPRGIS